MSKHHVTDFAYLPAAGEMVTRLRTTDWAATKLGPPVTWPARETWPDIWPTIGPMVAVTGYGQQTDREQSLAAGFDHHFVKPVDSGALVDLLATVAARKL